MFDVFLHSREGFTFSNSSTGIPHLSACLLSALWNALFLDGYMASHVAENFVSKQPALSYFHFISINKIRQFVSVWS